MTDRQLTLRLAIAGIIETVKLPPMLTGTEPLTHRNATETIGRRVESLLRRSIAEWDETGEEPDWAEVVAGIRTDGREYIGPSGTWVDFVDEDAPILAYVSEQLQQDVSRHLNAVLRALAMPGSNT